MKFNTVKLGEYLYIKGRIGWKGLKKKEYLDKSNFRIINGESLTENGIDWNKAGYISRERYEESPEIMLQPDDILISKDGTIGKIGYVESLETPTTVASGIFVIRNQKPEIINTRFIYHFFCSKYFKNFITMRTEGSVIPHLYQKDFVDLDFPLPELSVQDKIVGILDAICHKIDLNKNINENLQQQMSAIYKEKFSYVLQGNTATVEQIVAFSNGKKRPNEEGNIPVYGGNGVLAYTNKFNSQNCIIIGRVGAYCGNVSYSPKECWVSDNAIEAKSKVSVSQLFAFHLLKNAELPSRHIGTGQPLMTQGILNAIPCALPDLSEIDAFNDLCEPLQQQFDNNLAENVQLAALRETILPKLMSGELSLSDIEL